MANTQPNNWIKMALMILCMQMLSNTIVLPHLDAAITITKLVTTNQEDTPIESEDGEIEEYMSIDAIEMAKKDKAYPNTNILHIIPLDNTAASLCQPELHTPPPKLA